MPADEQLAECVRKELSRRQVNYVEKRMMGGLCFMVDDKMCVGIDNERLMVRLDPAVYEESLRKPGCVPMDFTGRPMRGFVFVNPEGTAENKSLRSWIELALDFNPRARASKSKAKAVASPRSSKSSNQTSKSRRPSK